MQAGTSMRCRLFLSALFVLAAPFALAQHTSNSLALNTLGGEVVTLPGPGDQWTITSTDKISEHVTRTAAGKPGLAFAIALLPHDQPGDSCDFRVEGVNRNRNGSLYSHPELVPTGWPWLHSSMTDAKEGFLYVTCLE